MLAGQTIIKKCAKCGATKPATADFFGPDLKRKDGFYPYCRDCRRVLGSARVRNRSQWREGSQGDEKTCTKCEIWHPATAEFFYRKGRTFSARCKRCMEPVLGTHKHVAPLRVQGNTVLKACTRCGSYKSATRVNFSPSKEGRLGLQPWCRDCLNAARRDWAIKAGRVAGQTVKPKRVGNQVLRKCTGCEQWFPANQKHFYPHETGALRLSPRCRDCVAKKQRAYGQRNREKALARVRSWQLKNRERVRVYGRSAKAKRRSATGSYTIRDVRAQLTRQHRKCFYCTTLLMGDAYEIDHFLPIRRGGASDRNNIVLACRPCNRRKSSRHPREFLLSHWPDRFQALVSSRRFKVVLADSTASLSASTL
jgi:5-methylcytosine-specific restriction endonuclease McrA